MYIYAIAPIDFWNGWQSAEEIVSLDHNFDWINEIKFVDPDSYFSFLRKAKHAALMAGWEGDMSDGPYISMLPDDGDPGPCKFMIAWKQSNNGTTFIASPFELPWLGDSEEDKF